MEREDERKNLKSDAFNPDLNFTPLTIDYKPTNFQYDFQNRFTRKKNYFIQNKDPDARIGSLPDPIDIDENVDSNLVREKFLKNRNAYQDKDKSSNTTSKFHESEADRIDFAFDNINRFERKFGEGDDFYN